MIEENKSFLSTVFLHEGVHKELSLIKKIEQMVTHEPTLALANEFGMCVQNISWEDSAREKESCWGPNISDMTLQVEEKEGDYRQMPVIRQPNFSDKTHDVPIDSFSVLIGNESAQENMTRLLLKDYLSQISNYLPDGTVKGGTLLAERDTHVIHSVQACFLPALPGEEIKFNVALYNYQSYENNPAVLAIVISSHGTSAQIIDNGAAFEGQKLVFNKNNKACDFVASRLKDFREEEGQVREGALSHEEDENRKLLILQIPLKVKKQNHSYLKGVMLEKMCYFTPLAELDSISEHIDDAHIAIGEEKGEFPGLKGLTIERDERYPIRVTTQLYKITDEGVINRKQMEDIVADIRKAESIGSKGSSLVLEDTDRVTEWES